MAPSSSGLLWSEVLCCPVCSEIFSTKRLPINLACGHAICRPCLQECRSGLCPIDQTAIPANSVRFPVNRVLLRILGAVVTDGEMGNGIKGTMASHFAATEATLLGLAGYLHRADSERGGSVWSDELSRPLQRKLVSLLCFQLLEPEGRCRAIRTIRSLAERVLVEILLAHQNPAHVSANLWSAVRSRGCQFLGPAMQEEVLRLILLTLSEGALIARKTLVMYIVQTLSEDYPQVSKTCVGHVVQLLYRASCFNVIKRDGESSLMQLKGEFRTYETLRREHDAQVVQIAMEAGLRISPDQWSALLYGDQAHRSHMQSIIDRLQSPQAFAQSVQELAITVQRYGDPEHLSLVQHFERMASIDPTQNGDTVSWPAIDSALGSMREIVDFHVSFTQKRSAQSRCIGAPAHNSTGVSPMGPTFHRQNYSGSNANSSMATSERLPSDFRQNYSGSNANNSMVTSERLPGPPPSIEVITNLMDHRYKTRICRDISSGRPCPRGPRCTYAHSPGEVRLSSTQQSSGHLASLQPGVMPVPMRMPTTRMPPPSIPLLSPQQIMLAHRAPPVMSPTMPPPMIQMTGMMQGPGSPSPGTIIFDQRTRMLSGDHMTQIPPGTQLVDGATGKPLVPLMPVLVHGPPSGPPDAGAMVAMQHQQLLHSPPIEAHQQQMAGSSFVFQQPMFLQTPTGTATIHMWPQSPTVHLGAPLSPPQVPPPSGMGCWMPQPCNGIPTPAYTMADCAAAFGAIAFTVAPVTTIDTLNYGFYSQQPMKLPPPETNEEGQLKIRRDEIISHLSAINHSGAMNAIIGVENDPVEEDDATSHVSYTVANSVLCDADFNYGASLYGLELPPLPLKFNTILGPVAETMTRLSELAATITTTARSGCVTEMQMIYTTGVAPPATVQAQCTVMQVTDTMNQPLPTPVIQQRQQGNVDQKEDTASMAENLPSVIRPLPPTPSDPQNIVSDTLDRIVDVRERLQDVERHGSLGSAVEKQHLEVELDIVSRQIESLDTQTKQNCLLKELEAVDRKIEDLGNNS